MYENENAPRSEDASEDGRRQIANMDEIDFVTLLMEIRIIQPG